MSLRRQNLSPTAQLLRNSRLFSVPNPLPRPPVSISFGAGSTRESPTATLPFPTHQAIATTPTSAARGDWGLKRPLPARSRILQTSKPVVKIQALDTVEHVTDFDSATDHVRTREKFEELGIPVLRGLGGFQDTDLTATPPKSSFERRADVTSYETMEGLDGAGMYLEALKESAMKRAKTLEAKRQAQLAARRSARKKGLPIEEFSGENSFVPFKPPPQELLRLQNKRWRHEGPWLPGMSAEEFMSYLQHKIAERKDEFNLCLKEYVQGQIYMRRSQTARNDQDIPLDPAEAEAYREAQEKEWSNITRADVKAGIHALRAQCAADPLTSDLVTKLIVPFLRLPPMKLKHTEYPEGRSSTTAADKYRFSDETTPHSTHPSAGLSYLRSHSFLTNHPILGPQAVPTPVPARVVQARKTRTSTETTARLGVAGFVTNDEFRQMGVRTRGPQSSADVDKLDIDTPGGKKLLVRPQYASVTPEGRVLVSVKRSFGPEVAVARGELEDAPPVREDNGFASTADIFRPVGAARSGIAELDAAVGQRLSADEEEKKQIFFRRIAGLGEPRGIKGI